MSEPEIYDVEQRRVISETLASLGGDLLGTYGATKTRSEHPDAPVLATLGAYLLERYGQPHNPDQEVIG